MLGSRRSRQLSLQRLVLISDRVRWVQIDIGYDAEDAGSYITPEERLKIAMAIQ